MEDPKRRQAQTGLRSPDQEAGVAGQKREVGERGRIGKDPGARVREGKPEVRGRI